MTKHLHIIGLILLSLFLGACTQSVSHENNDSFISLHDSYAWYDVMPKALSDTDTPSENPSLYVSSDITIYNEASLSKTYTIEAYIDYKGTLYEVSPTYTIKSTDEAWDMSLEGAESTRLFVSISGGPSHIEEEEVITLLFHISDSESHQYTTSTETIVHYAW